MKKLDIVILHHQSTSRRRALKYSIGFLGSVWEGDGHRVHHLRGYDRFVPADVCIVHVDLSVVPDEYLEFAAQYPVVLNGTVKSILRTSYSNNLLQQDSDYAGEVIVKSNNNHGGWPELLAKYGYCGGACIRFADSIGIPRRGFSRSEHYIVFDSLQDVPPAMFQDPYFVVEKFLPQLENGIYYTSVCMILGNCHQSFREGGTHPMVKYRSLDSSSPCENNDRIIAMGSELGIDFGKLDFAFHNGELVLFDVNKTPGMGSEKYRDFYIKRARALYEFPGLR